MSDALTLLRNFVKSKKDFHEEDDKIIFGDVFFYKNVKTTYLIYGTGKDGRPKDYYTLECLAFLIKNRDLQHSMYVKNAGTRNISVVLRPDRRELLSYLDGEVETTSSIDKYAAIEIAMQRSQPFSKTASTVAGSNLNNAGSSMNYNKRSTTMDQDDQDEMNKSNDYAMDTSNDQQTSGNQTTKEQFINRLTKKFDQPQSSRTITENIMPLSDQLSVEKIVSIKLKKKAQQRTKVSSEMDDDPLPGGGSSTGANNQNNLISSQLSSQANKKDSDRTSSQSKYNFDISGTSNFMSGIAMVGTDDSDSIMREIMQRERTCRTRFSVLQSSGKQFDKDITAFLQSIKAREEGADSAANAALSQLNTTGGGGSVFNNSLNSSQANLLSQQNAALQKSRALGYNRFDQERYSAKDETGGFSIDTKLTYQPNGGTISLATNTNIPPPASGTGSQPNLLDSLTKTSQGSKPGAFFQSTQLTQQKPNIMTTGNVTNKAKTGPGSVPLTKRSHSNPIIIIPAARTSLIQMLNVADILQDLKYVSTDDKRKALQNQNVYKESELILHRKEDGTTVQFKVIDNIAKLAQNDWDRVVAVFAQGAQWQFKDWLIGDNPSEIFTKVKGFHLKLSGIPLDPNIAKWSVTVIELDTNKRHLDRARMLAFWDELDKYMLKSKSHLC